MNEPHDEASAAEQEQVSRLLAAAGGPPPELPHDVSERLDDVLAGLVKDRETDRETGLAPADEVAGVTELAPRRRRWPQLLVAAAAVSVLGIGLGNIVQPAQQEAMTADSAGSAAEEEPRVAQREDAVEGSAPLGSAPLKSQSERSAEDQDGRALTGSVSELASRPRLQSESLTVDVQRIEDFGLAVPVADTQRQWADACVRPETQAGAEWLPVRLDGEPAVLVLGAPTDGRRTAEVFTCDEGDRPAVSTTVDAR